jgi:hypothetical protein
VKVKDGFVGEGLKADELKRLEMHAEERPFAVQAAYRNRLWLTSQFQGPSTRYRGAAIIRSLLLEEPKRRRRKNTADARDEHQGGE